MESEKIKDKNALVEHDGSITLPGWFLKVIAAFSGIFTCLFLPWAVWMSVQVMDLRHTQTEVSQLNLELAALEACYRKDFLDLKIEITKLQKENLTQHERPNP